jgi:predicted ATPase
VYVRSLRIQNLRCFREAQLTLQYPGREQESPPTLPNINLLLGDNGSGKTTVFKAIALAILAPVIEGSGYVPYELTRRKHTIGEGKAEVEADVFLHGQDVGIHGTDFEPPGSGRSRVRIHKIRDHEQIERRDEGSELEYWQEMYEDESPAFFLVAYGATRWVTSESGFEPLSSQRKRRRLRYQRVAGVFEEQIVLTPLLSWLPKLRRTELKRYRKIEDLINQLLPEETRFLGHLDREEYLFVHRGVEVPFGALSDGYRAYLGWITDLLYNMNLGCPPGTELRDLRGVVLVDEIDLHLHPEWQRQVVPTISKALPNLQFVLSTHSPIVAGTLSAKNIFVLEMDDTGASTVRQLEESIHGLNADQVLVSPYFNLMTSRAPDAVDGLRRLSRKAMEGDRDAALSFLEQLAGGSEVKPGR